MARTKTTKNGFERLLSASKTIGQSARRPWRHRMQRKIKKLTYAEKNTRKERRLQEKQQYRDAIIEIQELIQEKAISIRETLGKYTVQHIIDDVYQTHRRKQSKRKAGMFNAFVSLEMEHINSGKP